MANRKKKKKTNFYKAIIKQPSHPHCNLKARDHPRAMRGGGLGIKSLGIKSWPCLFETRGYRF